MKINGQFVARCACLAFALISTWLFSPAIGFPQEQVPTQPPSLVDSAAASPEQVQASEPTPIEPPEPEAEPHPAETHYVLGTTRLNSGDLIGAVEELREALRLQPEFVQARMSLGTPRCINR